ncbi:MAG: oxidoreductase [Gammaproteobacteria bacterium TMED78]|nr:MAG: oxidoreductase [Gammaproteobacteria bacterium TMED78]
MTSRREILKYGAFSGISYLLPNIILAQSEPLIRRAIPSTGEFIPIIGLGSSANFSSMARAEEFDTVRSVMSALIDNGGTVFDTAPSYAAGASEEVAGQVVNELNAVDKVFWATKVNVQPRGSSSPVNPQDARAQIERSFNAIGKNPIDLIQVHNLADVPTQLGILKDIKSEGRVKYIGVTTTASRRYQEAVDIMKNQEIDFIGIDYAIDDRDAADYLIPAAADYGVAVMVYLPFGRSRLWSRVRGQSVPDWGKEFQANTWAQFFLKYIAANPAVTVITPSTSKPVNMLDNLGAGRGVLPDQSTLRRMEEVIDNLPSA